MAEAAAKKPPLDEVMLAMDVVDTLRHRDLLVDRELHSDDRDQRMRERLRDIYSSQGIEVPEHVINEGVAALKEDRFVYKPPASSLSSGLAGLYVSRSKWGKPLLAVAGVLVLAWLAYGLLIRAPAERHLAALPANLASVHQSVVEQAQNPAVDARADALLARGNSALGMEDTATAEKTLDELVSLLTALQQEYELRIVSRPGEKSGVWRIPDDNPNARNYYIVVEAVTPKGGVLTLPITSEEDGNIHHADKWAMRVDQNVYEAIGADKRDDGIIQNRRFGKKKSGFLQPEYEIPTTGAAITTW